MEDLTKQQIILLALLVSFVTSIATGITVVSVMTQGSPATITQTINRVVEKTIERASSGSDQAAVGTKETIIVKEDAATVSAIAAASKGMARIYWSNQAGSPEIFAGLGVITSSSGAIVAKTDTLYGGSFTAHLDGGNAVPVSFVSRDPDTGLSVFQAQQSSDPMSARVFAAVTLADQKALQIGQSVALVSGAVDSSAATGIISSLGADARSPIRVSVKDQEFQAQAVLVDLSGEIVGIRGFGRFDGAFVPSSIIKTYATP